MSEPAKPQDDAKPAAQTPTAQPADASASAKKGKPTVTRITVKGPSAGRWRAGRKFGAEPVEILLADLSDEQLAALQGDPDLICTVQ
jgi:hypothetical protein